MKFISTLKAERSIAQLLAERDVQAPGARKALDSLRKIGPSAIPTLIDAFANAERDHMTALVETLSTCITDRTLKEVATGLGHGNARCVSGTAAALGAASAYDANQLLELLGRDDVSVSALIEVLRANKQRLNPRELLRRAYDLEPREKAAVFKIIAEVASADLVPELINRLEGKDPAVRVHIISVLARFNQPDVAKALEEQLKDRNKAVRKAALAAVEDMPGERNIALLCAILRDPDLEARSKAIDLVVKARHPETMKHLVEVLRDESEDARRAAVEVLNGIADVATLKHLLAALEDQDWWVRSRASDALAKIGGPKVMDAVLQLVGDSDENIRRAAIEILNQTKDERAVAHLMTATQDKDWWVRERAADALAEIGSPKAVPALTKMLAGDARSVPAAVRALGRLGDSKIMPSLLPLLDHADKAIRLEALGAVARLADQKNVGTIKAKLQPYMAGADETLAKAAADAMVKLENRLSPTAIEAQKHDERLAAPGRTLLVEPAEVERLVRATEGAQKLDVSTLTPGEVIENRYRFIQKIGKGAFGTVVLVEDTVVDERLILKFLNPNVSQDEEMMKRFVHELRYSRKITHNNVIRIYDFLSLGGHYAISMEYFPSHTLGAELSGKKPLPFAKSASWAVDIATGMSVAHQVGIVHRDLKPANILINDEGLLKIVDFGVAAVASHADTQLTKTGYVIGSPKYMAPEQILGKKVDHRADIYSLGVIMYEMLAGVPPYSKGDHMSVMYQHVQGRCKPCEEVNPEIPPALAATVRKAMEVDKTKRFETMDELRTAVVSAG
ncbi:MAG: HEAT repeat domain-containing protein [Gammaproteobacteria bacterium]|nr:MAG: HEAT repeat domain-containing protein [Gammaproteobacteria bacterium]